MIDQNITIDNLKELFNAENNNNAIESPNYLNQLQFNNFQRQRTDKINKTDLELLYNKRLNKELSLQGYDLFNAIIN